MGVTGVLGFDLLVSVPIADAFPHCVGAIEELDEADAFFKEPPGEDTVTGEAGSVLVLGIVGSVGFEYGCGFLGEIGDLGDGHLHTGGQLVAGNAGG